MPSEVPGIHQSLCVLNLDLIRRPQITWEQKGLLAVPTTWAGRAWAHHQGGLCMCLLWATSLDSYCSQQSGPQSGWLSLKRHSITLTKSPLNCDKSCDRIFQKWRVANPFCGSWVSPLGNTEDSLRAFLLTYLEIKLTEQIGRLEISRINTNALGKLSFCDFPLTQIKYCSRVTDIC